MCSDSKMCLIRGFLLLFLVQGFAYEFSKRTIIVRASTYSRTHCDGSRTIFSYYTLTTGMFYVIKRESYRPYNTFCERGFFRWLQVASINYKCGLFVFFSRFVNTFFININVFFYRNFHDYLNKYLEVWRT